MVQSGFQIKPIRKSNKSSNRETLLTIHQNKIQEYVDHSGNQDVSGLINYYLDNGKLLMRYFDIVNTDDNNVSNSKSHTNNDIMSFFKSSPSSQATANTMETHNTPENTKTYIHNSPLNEVSHMKKSEIYEEYQSKINTGFIPERYCKKTDDIRNCSVCGKEATVIPNDAMIFCEYCGWEERILIDVDLPGIKDQNKDSSYFNYRKINHFNEWLAQFQAKETTDIPNEVYDYILLELRKEKIKNIADLKQKKLREILKRLNMNKYYEHIPHIINRLSGIPPPRLSPETEEKLREMFREIQTPFMKYCPTWRKNFLSYSYVLHKFCKILGKEEFLTCFPLLKSREKLYEMDRVWKMICEDLGWEFHRSI